MSTLSSDMRLGAMLRPQAFGRFFRDGKSCAIGAVLEARGEMYDDRRGGLHEIFNEGPEERCPVPGCSTDRESIAHVIVHLNDAHEWSRERIADWLQAIEEEDAVPIVQEVVVTR